MDKAFDLLDPGVIQDPQPTFAKMRRDAPVHWNDSVKGWFITRYFDVRTVVRDPRFSVEKMSPFADRATGSKQQQIAFLTEILGGWMVFKDPPAHTRLRQVLQSAFTTAFQGAFSLGALVAFMVTISNLSLFNIGAPFWGLVFGFVASWVMERVDFGIAKKTG